MQLEAPDDRPVGYSNRGGRYFDLLRDDLGFLQDISNSNIEMAYSRGIPAGEYTVNVHMYRNQVGVWPIKVQVLVSVKTDITQAAKPILRAAVELVREDEEETVFRFVLDKEGKLDRSSINHIYKALRVPEDAGRI